MLELNSVSQAVGGHSVLQTPALVLQWIALIFGWDKEEDQKACGVQERQFSFIIYLSPLESKSCAGHNSHTVLR